MPLPPRNKPAPEPVQPLHGVLRAIVDVLAAIRAELRQIRVTLSLASIATQQDSKLPMSSTMPNEHGRHGLVASEARRATVRLADQAYREMNIEVALDALKGMQHRGEIDASAVRISCAALEATGSREQVLYELEMQGVLPEGTADKILENIVDDTPPPARKP